jgi:hypothetical protein
VVIFTKKIVNVLPVEIEEVISTKKVVSAFLADLQEVK